MQKLVLGLLFSLITTANATPITEGAIICSASCSSSGKKIDHDTISSGIIYFSNFNDENSINSDSCLLNAVALPIASNRSTSELDFGINLKECSNIMMGKYLGKKVDLILEEQSDFGFYITDIKFSL